MIKKDDYIQKDEIAKIITYKQLKKETEKKEIIYKRRESKNTGMESLEVGPLKDLNPQIYNYCAPSLKVHTHHN